MPFLKGGGGGGGGGVRGTNKTAYDIFREQIKFGKAPKKFYAD